jgi:hypothetical protein
VTWYRLKWFLFKWHAEDVWLASLKSRQKTNGTVNADNELAAAEKIVNDVFTATPELV